MYKGRPCTLFEQRKDVDFYVFWYRPFWFSANLWANIYLNLSINTSIIDRISLKALPKKIVLFSFMPLCNITNNVMKIFLQSSRNHSIDLLCKSADWFLCKLKETWYSFEPLQKPCISGRKKVKNPFKPIVFRNVFQNKYSGWTTFFCI